MKMEDILKAEQEAKEFLSRVKVVREERKATRGTLFGDRNTGALRRQSMELTRALADMRNPKW